MTANHIFGPVCSRRLGRSLGIDLLPFKTCSYNCVYCECGATNHLTTARSEFFPAGEVIAELDTVLAQKPTLDYVTLAGSGEPTLSLSLGKIITHLKTTYPEYPVAVLTNGSLFSDPDVRSDVSKADLVIPTLTSTNQETFERIHRPAPGLSVTRIIRGLVELRKEFSGQLWLEVFLVPPLNTSAGELAATRDAIAEIRPDRIQINTLDRPATEAWVTAPDPVELRRIRAYFSEGGIPTDVVGAVTVGPEIPGIGESLPSQILKTLKRRPCTVEDLAAITGSHHQEVSKCLFGLLATGSVNTKRGKRGVFYYARQNENEENPV
ncbi:MAG: radical SAM protein [Methanoregula sp.]